MSGSAATMTRPADAPADVEAEPGPGQAEPTPKRPRWWLRVLAIVAGAALLVGGAELALRAIIPGVVANAVRENLELPSDHPVEIGMTGSRLLPALQGRVGQVEVTVPKVVVFDGIETTLHASADSLAFDPTTGDIAGGTASATIPSSSMSEVVSLATGGLVDEGEVRQGEILVGKTIELFGFEVPLSAALAVSVVDGDLHIQPNSVTAVGFDLSVEDLQGLLGEPAASVLGAHTVCVRDQMPRGIELTDIDLRSSARGGSAVVSVRIAPDALSNPAQQQPGTCETE